MEHEDTKGREDTKREGARRGDSFADFVLRELRVSSRLRDPNPSQGRDSAENDAIDDAILAPVSVEMRRDYGISVGWISGESGTMRAGVSGV